MNPFTQKSIFFWNVPAVQNGDAQKIADTLKAAGFGAVWVKVADGQNIFYSGLLNTLILRPNVSRAFVDTMHANGIAVAGWGFCYGTGDNEGRIAAQQVNELGLDGYIFDIESKFEAHPDRVPRAGQMIGTYNKNVLLSVPVGICSWAFFWNRSTGSQIHAPQHIKFLTEYADYGIPMVYWNRLDTQSKPAVVSDSQVLGDLGESAVQWKKITTKPIIPAGRAYTGDGNVVISGNVGAFGMAADLYYLGYSFWSLEHAIKIPDVWATLTSLPFHGEVPVPPVEPPTPPVEPIITITSVTRKGDGSKVEDYLWVDGKCDNKKFHTYIDQHSVVVPPPANPDPLPFPHLYRIKDDIEAGVPPRPYVRNGLPATVRLQGGKGTVELPDVWMAYVYEINKPYTNYQFNTPSEMKDAVGWHNNGDGSKVEQVVFSGNILEVTRIGDMQNGLWINRNRAYIKTVATTDKPPVVFVKPLPPNLHPLIHNFSIQYTDHLDLTTDERYARTLVMSNPGENLWIDVRELVRL